MDSSLRNSDEELRQKVSKALNDQLGSDAGELEVRVEDSVVLLTGAVEERETFDKLEEIIRGCEGVADLENWVTIGPNQIDQRQASENLRATNPTRENRH